MPSQVAKVARREFLQLADTYAQAKHSIAGHYISEKLDGTRCFWDGGLTRGMPTRDVPWAGIFDPKKPTETKAKIKPISTGLWSRYGNPIIAPDEFLNALPCCPLDGELWAGRGNFQLCRSICAGDTPDPRFMDKISYAVYSTPSLAQVFQTGLIKNAQMVREIDAAEVREFVARCLEKFGGEFAADFASVEPHATYNDELLFLRDAIETQNEKVFMHRQIRLSGEEDIARAQAEKFLSEVLDLGGEGAVIRSGLSPWTPKRHKGLLKFKPFEDAEAIVLGYRAGKEGKQGNVLGKIGTLLVRTTSLKNNVEFELGSGLTYMDREIDPLPAYEWACRNPGEIIPESFGKIATHFTVGCTVTFKYRELSDDGIPKEGRYWRRRDGVE